MDHHNTIYFNQEVQIKSTFQSSLISNSELRDTGLGVILRLNLYVLIPKVK